MSVRVVTVGAGGYASNYVEALLENMHTEKYIYSGVITRDVSKSTSYERIREEDITVCSTLQEYFSRGNKADLVVVGTPTPLHKEACLTAIKNGADVLCEKPIAPLYTDALDMLNASEKSGKFIGIGYQWSYAKAIRSLKEDILVGKLGNAKEFKCFLSWPRDWSYYNGSWKGRIRDEKGNWILDSVAGNAGAHFLHNMYFLLGDTMDTCAFPEKIRCELYRANRIENFDTCFLEIQTKDGVTLFYAASHAAEETESPKFEFVFEDAVVTYNMQTVDNHIIAVFSDGTVKNYGNPNEGLDNRLWDAVDAVTSRAPLTCTVKTAMAHTLTVNQLYENGVIIEFPKGMVVEDTVENRTIVKGLGELMHRAFEKKCLLSDLGIKWAESRCFDVRDIREVK